MSPTKIHKENWLLYTFIFFFALGILGFNFLDTSELLYNSRSQESISFFVLLFSGIVIAPLLEEISFRGVFLKKKSFILISLLFTSFYVVLSYENYYSIIIFLLYMCCFLLYRYYKSAPLFKILCVLNALLFGAVHYVMNDFASIEKGFIILFQISIGFLLIWITLNYSLLRSIIVHAIYNSIALGFLVIGLQFPETKINYYQDKNIIVEWQRVPVFESMKANYSASSKYIKSQNTTITRLYELSALMDTKSKKSTIIPIEPYMKYNFEITIKKNTKDSDLEKSLYSFLTKQKLIAPRKPIN